MSHNKNYSKALKWDKAKTKELFNQLRTNSDSYVREELVTSYLNLVEYLARKFRNRGEPVDDLIQVGSIGLIKAIDRFDPNRDIEFTTYATPTIIGEIKRYFRDKSWAVRVPRRMQELNIQINQAMEGIRHKLGRSPTINEIALNLNITPEEVVEAMETSEAYNFVSIDKLLNIESDEKSFSLLDYLGDYDKVLQGTEDRVNISSVLNKLSSREQRIIYFRFFKGLTQTEIADTLNISQMHVSRLLKRTLKHLRKQIKE